MCEVRGSLHVSSTVDVVNVFEIEGTILLLITLIMVGVKIFALVTSLMFTPDHYRAAGKLTKQAWVAIVGLGVVANALFWDPRNILNIAFAIAALVFLADVRPALRGLHQR